MASRAREGGKDFAWGAFAVPIEGIIERGRSTLGDRLRNPSRMLIRRRGFWLGSAHQSLRESLAMIAEVGLVPFKAGDIHSQNPRPWRRTG